MDKVTELKLDENEALMDKLKHGMLLLLLSNLTSACCMSYTHTHTHTRVRARTHTQFVNVVVL